MSAFCVMLKFVKHWEVDGQKGRYLNGNQVPDERFLRDA
jgi:hypothetical protein